MATTRPTAAPPTATARPTDTPLSTATPAPTATPDAFAEITIEALRARSYPGGPITIVRTLATTAAFTRYEIAYPSDGLRITGVMNVPTGEGPFPVIILNHGYVTPPSVIGTYVGQYADHYARNGYLTISPDYRGYGGSDGTDTAFRIGYAIDVLNLVGSIQTLPQADASRIGMWGHSMGGGVSTYAMVVSPDVKAYVLYGSMSADQAANWRHIRSMWNRSGPDEWARDFGGTPDELPEAYARISPINALNYVTAPIAIHHGAADNQVPPPWSADLAGRLQQAGATVEYYEYPGAPHSFGGADWTLFMQRTVEFFDRYVKSAT
jgi:dipeptidyl aminopeptidase/acylaminoacyl peptidase